MAELTLQQQVIIGASTLGLIAAVGGMIFAIRAFGPGNVFVIAPATGPLTVTIDGAHPITIPAGQHRTLTASQGQRTLGFELGGQTSTATVRVPNGWSNLAVGPAGSCYAEVDVTQSQYPTDGKHAPPKILATFAGERGRVLAGVPFFSEKELPKSIPDAMTVTMLLELPCQYVGHPDGDVLAVLGIGP